MKSEGSTFLSKIFKVIGGLLLTLIGLVLIIGRIGNAFSTGELFPDLNIGYIIGSILYYAFSIWLLISGVKIVTNQFK